MREIHIYKSYILNIPPSRERQSNTCRERQSNTCRERQSNTCRERQSNTCRERQSNTCRERQSNTCSAWGSISKWYLRDFSTYQTISRTQVYTSTQESSKFGRSFWKEAFTVSKEMMRWCSIERGLHSIKSQCRDPHELWRKSCRCAGHGCGIGSLWS